MTFFASSCMISEAFQWTKEPVNPTIVVKEVNSAKVSLAWEFLLAQGETMFSILIQRGRPGSAKRENIASKGSGHNTSFNVEQRFRNKYNVLPSLTLHGIIERDQQRRIRLLHQCCIVKRTSDFPSEDYC